VGTICVNSEPSIGEVVTIPTTGLRIGRTPERIRKEIRRNPSLAALVRTIGPVRVFAVADLDRVKDLLG
jgi:hypothetical protein